MALLVMLPSPAHAACPQELAVYSDPDKSLTLEFTPTSGELATVSHQYKVAMENDVVLDGIVQWGQGISRPDSMMMYQCPDGDVTGDELRACTIWEGVVYAVDEVGNVDFLPPEGADAAGQLLFPDLGRFVRYSAVFGDGKVNTVPWDVLKLSGCQE